MIRDLWMLYAWRFAKLVIVLLAVYGFVTAVLGCATVSDLERLRVDFAAIQANIEGGEETITGFVAVFFLGAVAISYPVGRGARLLYRKMFSKGE